MKFRNRGSGMQLLNRGLSVLEMGLLWTYYESKEEFDGGIVL